MKHFSFRTLVVGVALTTQVALATDEIFINTGDMGFSFGEAPQIDARAFYNSGTFTVLTFPLPYDFTSVLNYTNRGTMGGSVGFTFDLATSAGRRYASDSFVNQRGGLIEAYELFGTVASNTVYYPTFITVSATNIVNEGMLVVGNSGLLQLKGQNINLTRGGLEVGSVEPDMGAGYLPGGFDFRPEPGIYDLWWGVGTEPTNNYPGQDSSSIVFPLGGGTSYQAISPPHYVADNNAAGFNQVATAATFWTGRQFTNPAPVMLTLTNQDGTTTNVFAPTNLVRQAVLIGVSDTNNFSARARFYPSTVADVAHATVAIELRMANTNVVDASSEVNTIYVVDRLASETNLVFGTNIDITPLPTLRPYPYEVWRSAPREFVNGFNGNATSLVDFVYQRNFSNRFVTNFYAGYGAYVDYLTVRPPVVPGLSPLDQPGRIEVVGDVVDLTKARFRGMGVISVDAKHLVSTSNTVIDSPSLLYNLGSTNGLLTVKNLAQDSVTRMAGVIQLWSGLWTNQMAIIYTNNYYWDATTNYLSPLTNPVDVGIHVVILSADFLDATQRVYVHDMVARSTNIVIDDSMTVDRRLLLAGKSLTLNGRLILTNLDTTNGLPNWSGTNMPGVRFFTNNGTLTVPNIANVGNDLAQPIDVFANHGTLNAFTAYITADSYEESGTNNISNNLTVVAGAAKLEGGRSVVRGSMSLVARDAKLRNQSIRADEGVFLTVSDSLADAGVGSDNVIQVADGFHLLTKPARGDLLGTEFQTSAARFASVLHTWAAEDRGAEPEGFKDNAAIGTLRLDVYPGGELRFSGPADFLGNPYPGDYAMYVDYLQFQASMTNDLESVMYIYPGFTIYFGNSNMLPEDLDGKFEGRLRWVKTYAGATSGTPVASRQGGYSVQTIMVNAGLLDSATIDSDGDGTANYYDTWPFDGVTLKDVQFVGDPPTELSISWDAAAETVFRVERASMLVPADWSEFRTVTNAASSVQTLTITDTVPAGDGQMRYYRVRYDP